MVVILGFIFIVGIIFSTITQPFKKLRYDDTVKYTSKIKLLYRIILNVVFYICIGVAIAWTMKSFNAFQQMISIIDRQLPDSAVNKITVPQSISEQAVMPFTVGMFLLILASMVIMYVGMLGIYRIISTSIAYKQQKNNPTVSKLLKGIRDDNRQDIVSAYFEMKATQDKHPLFISQWESIVNMLLLDGEIEEAKQLNDYIAKREEYCIYRNCTFNSKFKISLFDYEALKQDEDRKVRLENKSPSRKIYAK